MAYLGDLKGYQRLAKDNNGQITQGGEVLVNKVYKGRGPDDKKNTADDGCIVLVGTKANPIVINGPVVIEKDLIIKGVISGQGTIYAGRNIHVLANVRYKDPPSWPKPDEDPYTTATANKAKDFVAFAAKGNVVIGDYTSWKESYKNNLNPPATQGYEVDVTDADLGYDTDGDSGNGYWFDGDYTAYDGGYKMGDTDPIPVPDPAPGNGKKPKKPKEPKNGGGGNLERRFYESSLSDDYISANSSSIGDIRRIDGMFYNDHAFAGDLDRCRFNGGIASRDEAIRFDRRFIINYDVRANRKSIDYVDINLPRSLVLPETRARQSG